MTLLSHSFLPLISNQCRVQANKRAYARPYQNQISRHTLHSQSQWKSQHFSVIIYRMNFVSCAIVYTRVIRDMKSQESEIVIIERYVKCSLRENEKKKNYFLSWLPIPRFLHLIRWTHFLLLIILTSCFVTIVKHGESTGIPWFWFAFRARASFQFDISCEWKRITS